MLPSESVRPTNMQTGFGWHGFQSPPEWVDFEGLADRLIARARRLVRRYGEPLRFVDVVDLEPVQDWFLRRLIQRLRREGRFPWQLGHNPKIPELGVRPDRKQTREIERRKAVLRSYRNWAGGEINEEVA